MLCFVKQQIKFILVSPQLLQLQTKQKGPQQLETVVQIL